MLNFIEYLISSETRAPKTRKETFNFRKARDHRRMIEKRTAMVRRFWNIPVLLIDAKVFQNTIDNSLRHRLLELCVVDLLIFGRVADVSKEQRHDRCLCIVEEGFVGHCVGVSYPDAYYFG